MHIGGGTGGGAGGAIPPPRFERGLECPSAPAGLGGMPLYRPPPHPQCLTFIGINTFDQFRPQVKFPFTASYYS